MSYEVTKLNGERSHAWLVSRMASAYPCDVPQVLYSALQKNNLVRRLEHCSHVYICDVTYELYNILSNFYICEQILQNQSKLHIRQCYFASYQPLRSQHSSVILCLDSNRGLPPLQSLSFPHPTTPCDITLPVQLLIFSILFGGKYYKQLQVLEVI